MWNRSARRLLSVKLAGQLSRGGFRSKPGTSNRRWMTLRLRMLSFKSKGVHLGWQERHPWCNSRPLEGPLGGLLGL